MSYNSCLPSVVLIQNVLLIDPLQPRPLLLYVQDNRVAICHNGRIYRVTLG